MRLTRFLVFVCLIAATLMIGFADASAATKKKSKSSKPAENKLYAAIVVDAQTGEVLMARQADSIRHPASLTKMMTLYMVFEAVDAGRLRMSDRIPMSKYAASMSPSKIGIPAGGSIRVEDAIRAIVTKSANDVSAAVAEKLGGSERNFASRMTRKARELGLSRTTFRNASGLPDPQQVTTARDMAKLAMALLRDYPHYYHYFGVRHFEYNGASYHNHNRLLGEYPGLDGIKTGYINASGFNLVASAKQNNRRLVGVVFGGRSWRSRNDHMVKLLDEGFIELGRRKSQIQTASLSEGVTPTRAAVAAAAASMPVPIPLPPPMMEDDTRGVPAFATRADETDGAEEVAAYTQQDSASISAMIDHVQGQGHVQGQSRGQAQGTPQNTMKTASLPSPPVPAPLPPARAEPDLDPAAGRVNMVTGNGATAPTVMQLRIPASQLPRGIPESQIVRTAATSPQGWAIQVGAFPSRAMTDQALRTAQSRLPSHLQGAQPVIVPQNTGSGLIFRARLQGYDEIQANAACAHLGACLVIGPGS